MAIGYVVCFMVLFSSFVNIIEADSRLRSTIKSKHGGIYDCVDFYEQPAFKHSLLRNHSFHHKMRPRPLPRFVGAANSWSLTADKSNSFPAERVGCPVGTVPIKRVVNKQDHAQPTRLFENDVQLEPGTHLAVFQTKSSSDEPVYYGVGAVISIWKPEVKENQYSGGQCTLQNGADSIRVGWMVNPSLYKDNEPHMFIHTSAGGTHCYNTECPGFVLIRSDMPPDITYTNYSKTGERIYDIKLLIYRDPDTGNWWLAVGFDLIRIGFWPENIFTSLGTHGNYIACGGVTYNQPGQQVGDPPMGSGTFPLPESSLSAVFSHFVTVNEKFQTVDVTKDQTEKFCDEPKKYDIFRDYANGFGLVYFFGGYGDS